VIDLNIVNNGSLGASLRLQEIAGSDFNVVDVATAAANNTGTIIFDPNMGAFDNIPATDVEAPTVP
jgi:hypothetical protein